MTEKTNSLLSGAFLLALGVPLTLWIEHQARTEGTYYPKAAFVGPFLIVMSVAVLIHAPKIPMETLTVRDMVYALIGTGCGLFNLHRYGAFGPDSKARMPILVGLGTAVVFLIYRQIVRRPKA